MKEFKYVVTDPEGIHARPAGILLEQGAGDQSTVQIHTGSETTDATERRCGRIAVNCQDHKRREDSRRKEDLWRYGTGC